MALAPFREHPEMVLKEEDIAAFVANWEPKSKNIQAIADTLGLGLDSFTFLDDNPYERAEVRRALPEVDVPILPEDPTGFRRDAGGLSLLRARGLHRRRPRPRRAVPGARPGGQALAASAGSLEDYQASLGMTARLGGIDAAQRRPRGAAHRQDQPVQPHHPPAQPGRARGLPRPRRARVGLQVRLADRFADHGLIAVALAEVREDGRRAARLEIDTLLMSCRVLGRGVEALVLAELGRIAAEAGCTAVTGAYIPTGRNGMVADLYPRHGFAKTAGGGRAPTRWSADPAALTAPGTRIHLTRD